MKVKDILTELQRDIQAMFSRGSLPVNVNVSINPQQLDVGRHSIDTFNLEALIRLYNMKIVVFSVTPAAVEDGIQLRVYLHIPQNALTPFEATLHHNIMHNVLELAKFFEVQLNTKRVFEA